VSVGFHAYDEPELACARADAEKVGMRQRLATAERHVEHVHRGQVAQEGVVLFEGQRLAAQAEIVVAEETIEIAAIGELDQDREQTVLVPGAAHERVQRHDCTASTPISASSDANWITVALDDLDGRVELRSDRFDAILKRARSVRHLQQPRGHSRSPRWPRRFSDE
jgi:hypothetical protein